MTRDDLAMMMMAGGSGVQPFDMQGGPQGKYAPLPDPKMMDDILRLDPSMDPRQEQQMQRRMMPRQGPNPLEEESRKRLIDHLNKLAPSGF